MSFGQMGVVALAVYLGVLVVITGEPAASIFGDGFESGDTTAWSAAIPAQR